MPWQPTIRDLTLFLRIFVPISTPPFLERFDAPSFWRGRPGGELGSEKKMSPFFQLQRGMFSLILPFSNNPLHSWVKKGKKKNENVHFFLSTLLGTFVCKKQKKWNEKKAPCIFEKKVKKKQTFQKKSGDYAGLFFGFFVFFAKKGPPGAEKTE